MYLQEYDDQIGQLFLNYIDEGPKDGKVLLLVHGVPTSSWSYRAMIKSLVEKGYRVIAPDNLGFGTSAKPSDKEHYTLEKQGRRLLYLMDQLKISTWAQVLHDVGGPISWEMLALTDDRIDALIILNTFAYEEGWNPPKSMDNPLVQFSMGLIGFRNRAIIRSTICNMIAVPENLNNDLSLAGYFEPLEDGADRAYLHFLSSFDDVRSRLSLYKMVLQSSDLPAVIIWGAHDETLVGEESIPLFKQDLSIPDYHIHYRGDAKHLVMEELPDFIVEKILELYPTP